MPWISASLPGLHTLHTAYNTTVHTKCLISSICITKCKAYDYIKFKQNTKRKQKQERSTKGITFSHFSSVYLHCKLMT